jgi:lysozyme family protein
MSAKNYAACMRHVLVFEGGKVDDEHDPGGRTNQGVIQRVYDGWRERNRLPQRDVYLMTNEERDAIYREGYWNQIRGDQLASAASVDQVVAARARCGADRRRCRTCDLGCDRYASRS